MNPPAKPRFRKLIRQFIVAGMIASLSFAVAMLTRIGGPPESAMAATNDLFYDIFYRLRPLEDQTHGPVVIVAADQDSLNDVDQALHYGWPWPRELWGNIATYLSNAGAKAIVFDIVFSETSTFQNVTGDDDTFADAIKASKSPVIFGSFVNPDGKFEHFAPPIPSPGLAAVNVGSGKVYRKYSTVVLSRDSLAMAAVKAARLIPQLNDQPFLLHYYGPNVTPAGTTTFSYTSAIKLLDAQLHGKEAEKRLGLSPDFFKGKIVLLGAITVGTYDLKASPLSTVYPGVEVQATAIQNLIEGQKVSPLSSIWLALLPLVCGVCAAVGVIVPRKASLKLLMPAVTIALLFGIGIVLFRAEHIRWLPPAESLLVLLLATPTAFAYTYFAEDRQRRFMLKALSKVVSPAIAEELARDPERLALGTVRTQLTVVFTDLANFTDLSESMDVQQLGELLNRYLGAMSDQVLLHNGTLDKYIGDAVMCFWNAPLPQLEHATLACRTALTMKAREEEIKLELGEIGKRLFTRIGINTTSAAIGFVGSSHLFNYTALGDGVNLASRLEGANKLYGTRILISQSTAALVSSSFYLRKIDTLRVKGKTEPIAVYELLAERNTPTPPSTEKIAQYETALAAYQKQDWDTAERLLLELCARFGEDFASGGLLKRIALLRQTPPPADWDGTHDAKEK